MQTKDLHQVTAETRARLMVLYHRIMIPEDCFILSKGHSAGTWYAVLWSKGLLSSDRLDSFAVTASAALEKIG